MNSVPRLPEDGEGPSSFVAKGRPRSTWVAFVVALLLVSAVGLFSPWTGSLNHPESQRDSDFQILHAAGRGLVEQRDIHDPEVLDEIGRRDGRPATPFCASNPLVIRTFGLLSEKDVHSAYRVGLIINGCLAVLAVILLAGVVRALGRDAHREGEQAMSSLVSRGRFPWMALAFGLVALGLGEGLWMSLAMNTTNLLALVALLAALQAACAGRSALEGTCLAIALVAKTSPVLMLLIVLLAGRWRVALWAMAVTGVLATVSIAWSGWAVHESWAVHVLPVLGYAPEVTPGSFNNSLHAWNLAPNGLLTRTMLGANAPRLFALLGAWLVTGLVFVQLYGALKRKPGRDGDVAHVQNKGTPPAANASTYVREYALGITAMLLVSSVTWPHHLVLLAIPAIWFLWCVTRAIKGRSAMGPALVGLMCFVGLALPLGTFDESPNMSVGIAARTAMLVVLFAVLVPREQTSRPGQSTSASA